MEPLVLFYLAVFVSAFSTSHSFEIVEIAAIQAKAANLNHIEVNVTPTVLGDLSPGDVIRCSRVHITGLPRTNFSRLFSADRISFTPYSSSIEEKHVDISICLHRESTRWYCSCRPSDWEIIPKGNGKWTTVSSPYDDRFIDVMFTNLTGTMSIRIQEESHRWRIACLVIGSVTLLLAPILSRSYTFYYYSYCIGTMVYGLFLLCASILLMAICLAWEWTERQNELFRMYTIWSIFLGFVLLLHFGTNFRLYGEPPDEGSEGSPMFALLLITALVLLFRFGRSFVRLLVGRSVISLAGKVKWALRIVSLIVIFQSTVDYRFATTAVLLGLLLFVS